MHKQRLDMPCELINADQCFSLVHSDFAPPSLGSSWYQSPLNFTVIGGWSVGYPILVSELEAGSDPEKAGLRVGDMVSAC